MLWLSGLHAGVAKKRDSEIRHANFWPSARFVNRVISLVSPAAKLKTGATKANHDVMISMRMTFGFPFG